MGGHHPGVNRYRVCYGEDDGLLAVRVGEALLDLARAAGARDVAVVGTGKNVGKTVVIRALLGAANARGARVGLTSVGRDGESVDALDANAKPRLYLAEGTVVATAAPTLPASPASEIIDVTNVATAIGPLLFARVRRPGFYEIAGAPSASGTRFALERMASYDTDTLLLDGAIDRIAALADGDEAVVVATGAATAATIEQAAERARALVARLRVPAFDPSRPFVRLSGALTAQRAAALVADREMRQIVVRDPTRIALDGKAFDGFSRALELRCERPLRPIAVTVASIGRERYFEPRAFARAVADAANLPTFDVYAGAGAA